MSVSCRVMGGAVAGRLVAGFFAFGALVAASPSLQAQKLLATIPLASRQHSIRGLAFSPDGHTLAVHINPSPKGDEIALYDVETRRRLGHIKMQPSMRHYGVLAFTSDSKTLVTSSELSVKVF